MNPLGPILTEAPAPGAAASAQGGGETAASGEFARVAAELEGEAGDAAQSSNTAEGQVPVDDATIVDMHVLQVAFDSDAQERSLLASQGSTSDLSGERTQSELRSVPARPEAVSALVLPAEGALPGAAGGPDVDASTTLPKGTAEKTVLPQIPQPTQQPARTASDPPALDPLGAAAPKPLETVPAPETPKQQVPSELKQALPSDAAPEPPRSVASSKDADIRASDVPRQENGRITPAASPPLAPANDSTDAAVGALGEVEAEILPRQTTVRDRTTESTAINKTASTVAPAPDNVLPTSAPETPSGGRDRTRWAEEVVTESTRSGAESQAQARNATQNAANSHHVAATANLVAPSREPKPDATVFDPGSIGSDPFSGETRVSEASARTASAQPVPTTPELPRPTILQIVEAMRGGATSIDVKLSPEELGRVTLSLGTHDGILNVIVQAERPDTAELIRRSLDLLLAEAKNAGFEDVAFSFGDSENGSGETGESGGDASTSIGDYAEPGPDNPKTDANSPTVGLDLRL